MSILPDIIGLIGVGLLLASYFMLIHGKIKSGDLMYPAMNTIASACLIVSLLYNFNLAAMAAEMLFLCVLIYGIHKTKRNNG